jgi:single-stranded-DNA-specific exonuclease
MSLLGRKWRILAEKEHGVDVFEQFLHNRQVQANLALEQFLNPDLEALFDPFLFKDMAKAVARIRAAVSAQEKIIVFGDYDVDGITATALVVKIIRKLGGLVSYRLPHRVNDGYGLKAKFVEDAKAVGATLLITVDCGISCPAEIELAKNLGIDVILTDHHQIPANYPEAAFAILHPKMPGDSYPEPELTGAGVAFKLAQALLLDLGLSSEEFAEALLDFAGLAALGTVADCAPLVGENRIIVAQGLKSLAQSHDPGIRALLAVSGIDLADGKMVRSQHLGFSLAPRINAAGRIDDPYFALQLLLAADEQKANKLAAKLNQLNLERQKLTRDAVSEAEAEALVLFDEGKRVLVVGSPDWHPGIVGLIAGNLAQKYSLPVLALHEHDGSLVGSARGPVGFDWARALSQHGHFFDRFGGHMQAAGLTMPKDNLDAFKRALNAYMDEEYAGAIFATDLLIDLAVDLSDLSLAFFELLNQLEPFGIGNEEPLFLLRDVLLTEVKWVSDGKHLLGRVSSADCPEGIKFVQFGASSNLLALKPGQKLNLVARIEQNQYRGKTSLELRAVDYQIVD